MIEGRLDVCYNGQWGTVCNYGFSDVDASVACRQLGFTDGYTISNIPFLSHDLPTLLDEIMCNGTELRLIDCESNHNDYDCDDVWIGCTSGQY